MHSMESTNTISVWSLDIEYIFYQIYKLVTGSGIDIDAFGGLWDNFKIFSTILSLLFVTGTVYAIIRISQLRAEEYQRLFKYAPSTPDAAGKPTHASWQRVLDHVASPSQNDWKIAIMEADIMLDDLLTSRGYQGESLGEKLKQIDKNQLRTIDLAWEAHKIRNEIYLNIFF